MMRGDEPPELSEEVDDALDRVWMRARKNLIEPVGEQQPTNFSARRCKRDSL
jgi:hypothetical protein